jgi:hypothetical protein
MTLAEWHIALANSLGDPVVYDATGSTKDAQLIGNVRYSAANRESYLQRAMAKIHSDALAVLAERSRSFQVRTLQTWFPTSTTAKAESASDSNKLSYLNFFGIDDALFIYSLSMRSPSFAAPLQGHLMGHVIPYSHFTGGVSVPILPSDEAYRRANTRGISDSSPYAYITRNNDQTIVYVMAQKYYEHLMAYLNSTVDAEYWWGEELWLIFEVTYLPKAPVLSTLRLTDNVWFESIYDDAVLKYATLHGQIDSQEANASEGASQLLYRPHFTLQPDIQGGQYGNL